MTVKRACFFVLSALLLTTGYARADFFTGRDAFRRGDYETAMKELKPEADKGNAEAITVVAKMYQGGFGVKKDVAKATELFKRGAELCPGTLYPARAIHHTSYCPTSSVPGKPNSRW